MSGEERHFKARRPLTMEERVVDILLTSQHGTTSAKPRTVRGREFLREFYATPRLYTDQAIDIQPGRFHQTFVAALREAKVRAQYDGSENHREVS